MDEAAKKTALRMIPYGLFVISTRDGEQVNAFAGNWVTQASFQPPLVVVASKAGQASTDMIQNSRLFCVNVLESGQADLAATFFRPMERVGDKFGDIEFSLSPNGCPVLKDALAYFECRVVEQYGAGDHTIFVGEVVEAGLQREGDSLTLAETGFKYGG